MVFLEFFDNWKNFLDVDNLLILSCIQFEDVGEVDIGISLANSKINL
jgi:hypothetical protein